MDNNRNTGLTPEERQNVVNEVFAERAAAEEAAKERKNQEEAANREQGWKLIFEYLDKVKDEIVKPILTQKTEPTVYEWFDNAAVLVKKYDAVRFERASDTFIFTVKKF